MMTHNSSPEDMSDGVMYIPDRKSSKKIIALKLATVLLAVLLLTSLVALVVVLLYVESIPHSICTSEECLRSATNLKASMDENVDPCENFYEYACGRWDEHNLGHVDSKHSNFVLITDKINYIIKNFIKSRNRQNETSVTKMVRDFYQSCDNNEKRNSLGYEVIFKYLGQAGLPNVPAIFSLRPDRWHEHRFDWVKASVGLKKTFGMDLFVNFEVDNNMFNQEEVVIYLVTHLTTPILPQLVNEEHIETYRTFKGLERLKEKFKPIVKHVISEVLTGKTRKLNLKLLDRVSDAICNMTFEIQTAANVVGGGRGYEDRMGELKKMKISHLQNLTDQVMIGEGLKPLRKEFSWRRQLELLFSEIANVTLDPDEGNEIYYFEKELPYIISKPAYLSKLPDVMIELYAWWKAVYLMIGSTTAQMAETIANSLRLKWPGDCVDLTVKYFNSAVGFGVIKEEFIRKTKPEVTKLFINLKRALLERIEELHWIDNVTRETAIKKIHALNYDIGAPDWILNETAVLEMQSLVNINADTFLDNLIQLAQATVIDSYDGYGISEDVSDEESDEYYTSLTDVNAYYHPLQNLMTIPWAILNAPAYHLGLESLNYGALGTIIGHELTHGFDTIGRQYDEGSNHRMWWSGSSLQKYENKSQCFIHQYGNFTINIFGLKIPLNGTRNLDENIADNGGMRIAYLALQNYLNQHGPEEVLPGFEYFTSEQLFFLSQAHFWCTREGNNIEKLLTHLDAHSPSDSRVIGILQNTKEFAEAFNCPLGSGMNPKRTRCSLW